MSEGREGMRVDPRYAQATREAIIGLVLFVLNFAWWFACAYGLGSKPVNEYTYVMGLPAWFFYSAVVGWLLFTLLAWICVKYFFKDMPLDGEEGGGRE